MIPSSCCTARFWDDLRCASPCAWADYSQCPIIHLYLCRWNVWRKGWFRTRAAIAKRWCNSFWPRRATDLWRSRGPLKSSGPAKQTWHRLSTSPVSECRLITNLALEFLDESGSDVVFRYDVAQGIRIYGRGGRGPLQLQECCNAGNLALVSRIGERAPFRGQPARGHPLSVLQFLLAENANWGLSRALLFYERGFQCSEFQDRALERGFADLHRDF